MQVEEGKNFHQFQTQKQTGLRFELERSVYLTVCTYLRIKVATLLSCPYAANDQGQTQ